MDQTQFCQTRFGIDPMYYTKPKPLNDYDVEEA
jgi:hypothetical protein